ncbi:MAG: hypothetical protein RL417_2558 [Pseudomonadota bacterium]|jgi:hypothetical protein
MIRRRRQIRGLWDSVRPLVLSAVCCLLVLLSITPHHHSDGEESAAREASCVVCLALGAMGHGAAPSSISSPLPFGEPAQESPPLPVNRTEHFALSATARDPPVT